MDTSSSIALHFEEHLQVIEMVSKLHSKAIKDASKKIADSLLSGGTLIFCGNGGSAADSQHLAAEMVGRFMNNRKALRSIALNTDTSIITCVANDFSYEEIFSRQLEALAREGDVLVAISTSGNSLNICRALTTANEMGLYTIALLGKEGGSAITLADSPIVVSSNSTARIQESHILIGHILCSLIEKELGYV